MKCKCIFFLTRRETFEWRQAVDVCVDSGQSLGQSLSIHRILFSLERPQKQLQGRKEKKNEWGSGGQQIKKMTCGFCKIPRWGSTSAWLALLNTRPSVADLGGQTTSATAPWVPGGPGYSRTGNERETSGGDTMQLFLKSKVTHLKSLWLDPFHCIFCLPTVCLFIYWIRIPISFDNVKTYPSWGPHKNKNRQDITTITYQNGWRYPPKFL